ATIFRKLTENGGITDHGQGDKTKEVPLKYYELADHLSERLVGSFSCHFYPNDLFASPYFDSCCQGNIARAIYYVWENVLTREDGALRVNLLLNRASPWADVQSCIPYTGQVDIKIKEPFRALKVRMND